MKSGVDLALKIEIHVYLINACQFGHDGLSRLMFSLTSARQISLILATSLSSSDSSVCGHHRHQFPTPNPLSSMVHSLCSFTTKLHVWYRLWFSHDRHSVLKLTTFMIHIIVYAISKDKCLGLRVICDAIHQSVSKLNQKTFFSYTGKLFFSG